MTIEDVLNQLEIEYGRYAMEGNVMASQQLTNLLREYINHLNNKTRIQCSTDDMGMWEQENTFKDGYRTRLMELPSLSDDFKPMG